MTPRLVGRSSFGSKKELSEIQMMRFEIHDFGSLPHKRGEFIELPPLEAHGYSWTIDVYPRGEKQSNEPTKRVAIYLKRVCSSDSTDPTVVFSAKCAPIDRSNKKTHCFSSSSKPQGWRNFARREEILDPAKNWLDKDGTLTVDVSLQIYREKKRVSFPVWFPQEHQPGDIVSRLWMSHEFADVTFSIGDEIIPAHKFVLAASAATLFDSVKDTNGEEAVAITNVEADVFKAMLQYFYTGELARLDFVDGGEIDSKALLITADRFGCTKLKLRVESEITAYALDKSNAAEWLLVAESHSCALMKEASVNIFIAHASTLMKSAEWPKVAESNALLLELMLAQNGGGSISNNKDQNDDIECMDVSSLRERLEAAGLDVDGSREMLVNRLKNDVADSDDDEE